MKLLREKKIFLIFMGMALCYTHSFLAKSKKKDLTEELNITQDAPSDNSTSAAETIVTKDPLLFKSPLIKEYLDLAQSYFQKNNYEKAADFYTKAVAMDACNFSALKGLATISCIQKEFNRAIDYYETIIVHYPRCVSAHYNVGLCYLHNKQYSKAIKELRKAVSLDTHHYKGWNALGTALEAENDLASALDAYQQALEINSQFASTHFKLGMLHKTMHNYQEAITHLKHALSLENNNQYVLMELANVFSTIHEHERALNLYVTVLRSDPLNIPALYNCGFTLKKQHRLDQALEVYDKVLALDPHHAKAHYARAEILLSRGDFVQGFREYEWRFAANNQPSFAYEIPFWNGANLANKTILVHAEQSVDDTIQFARYIPLLQEQGATVVFQVQNSLKQLFQLSDKFGTIIDYTEIPPVCDIHIPLMSLPSVLKTTLATIPPSSDLLKADEHLVAYWKSYLAHDTNLKIGIYWYEDEQKNIHPSVLEAIAAINHVTLYSLHRVDQKEQHKIPSLNYLRDFGAHFDTIHGPFMDSAAIIKNCDLIISLDSSMGHLAATLGAQTWIIVPQQADWRWLIDRSDSPWYPTVRLFRQVTNSWHGITSSLMHSIQMLAQEKQRINAIARLDSLVAEAVQSSF